MNRNSIQTMTHVKHLSEKGKEGGLTGKSLRPLSDSQKVSARAVGESTSKYCLLKESHDRQERPGSGAPAMLRCWLGGI